MSCSWSLHYLQILITISAFQTIYNGRKCCRKRRLKSTGYSVYSLQRFGEDLWITCTAEEQERFIGYYFWMGLVKVLNQQSFWNEDLSWTGVSSFLSRIGLKYSFEVFM